MVCTTSSVLGYMLVSVTLVVDVVSLEAVDDVVKCWVESMVVADVSVDAAEVVGWVEAAILMDPDEVMGVAVVVIG